MKDSRHGLAAASVLTLAVLGAVVPLPFPDALRVATPGSPVTSPPGPVAAAAQPGSATVVPSGSVTASISWRTTTLQAGGRASGTITVENNSGKPIHLLGCGPVYQVLLVGAHYRPSPSWPLCARRSR